MRADIEQFLTLLRDSDEYIKDIFSKGSCFKLYKILKHLYPDAEPFKCGVHNDTLGKDAFYHIVTKIYGIFWDINGEFDPGYQFPLVEQMNDEDIAQFDKYSFSNDHYFLNCEECPYRE